MIKTGMYKISPPLPWRGKKSKTQEEGTGRKKEGEGKGK